MSVAITLDSVSVAIVLPSRVFTLPNWWSNVISTKSKGFFFFLVSNLRLSYSLKVVNKSYDEVEKLDRERKARLQGWGRGRQEFVSTGRI